MQSAELTISTLPNAVGVGYKPQHFNDLRENSGTVEWLEIHAENYMGDGGRPLAQLDGGSSRTKAPAAGVGRNARYNAGN